MTDYELLLKAAVRDTSLLENIFDHLPDVLFYVKDKQARYVLVNTTLVEQSGVRSKAEVCGRTADELLPGNGFSTLNQDMEVINKGKRIVDLLRLYLSWGGKKQWCLSTKYPILGEDGQTLGLIGISRRLPKPDQNHLNYKRLNDFIKVLDGNCGDKVLISDTAQNLGFSIDTFEKLSKEIFQLTPKQLLLQRRIERACDLLESTDHSVTQIATECGYSDHSAFSRQFKVATQLTPRDFRLVKRKLEPQTGFPVT